MRAVGRSIAATALAVAWAAFAQSAQYSAPPVLRPSVPLQLPPLRAPLSVAFSYTAVPAKPPSARTGKVLASGINWTCDKSACTASGPWLQPSVGACAALAREIGPIGSYGRKGAYLTPAQLEQCNRNATPVAAPDAPSESADPAPKPLPKPETTPAPRPAGLPIDVAELSIIGGAQGAAAAPAGIVPIRAPELSLVGGTVGPAPEAARTISITVPELSLSGG